MHYENEIAKIEYDSTGEKTLPHGVLEWGIAFLLIMLFCIAVVLSCQNYSRTVPSTSEAKIYFIAREGSVSYLEPVIKRIQMSENPYKYLIEALITGPPPATGLMPVLPPTTRVLKVVKSNGMLVVDFSKEVLTDANIVSGSSENQLLCLWAVANTVTQLGDVRRVRILIEGRRRGIVAGKRIENFWGSSPISLDISRNEKVIGKPDLPAWRFVDKQALASKLGWGEVVRGNASEKIIALTFDAGAGIASVDSILEELNEHGITSTFFLTGQFAEKYPEIVKRIAAFGHELGNHSYSHPNFVESGVGKLARELEKTESIVQGLTGISTKPYFRFPYGARNKELISQVNELGYLSVYWTIDSLDWMSQETPDSIRARVVSKASPGAVVLMHCNSPQQKEALPPIISELKSEGYKFVTLTEALK